MSEQGKCKKCGATITRSTTFCRSCNTVFPEFVEITEKGSPKEQPEKSKAPEYQGMTYSSPGYSKQEEKAEPKERSSEPEPEEPASKPETEPKEDESLEPPAALEEPKAEKTESAPPPETEPPRDPKVDESLRKEPSERGEKKDPQKEQVAENKSSTGEFAVFENPEFIQPKPGVRLIDSGKKFFSSAEIITELASETSRSPEEVGRAIDGFWNYVADIRTHYSPTNQEHWSLIIPHFGTFRFRFNWKKGSYRPRFSFKSSTTASAKAHRRTYSSKWADQWSGDLEVLSVRRKISVYVSEHSGLPLRLSDMILNRLLRTTRELCERGGRIHWARRGTMGTFPTLEKKGHSPAPFGNPERISAEGKECFTFRPSKGFMKRLRAHDSPEKTREKWSKPSSSTGGQAKNSGNKGCLPISTLVVIGLVLWIFVTALKDEEEPWEFHEEPGLPAYDGIEQENLPAFPSTRRNTPAPKSARTGIKTGIKFSNQLDFPVLVHWINFDGKRKKFFPLNPQEELEWSTYAGHTWLVTDLKDKALMFFIATKVKNRTHGLASITSENLPKK